ncbi:hypothetical protein D3C72_2051010 [compost metagenome]
MDGGHQPGNHNRADNAGIEGFDPGNHRQPASRGRLGHKVHAKELTPGHAHRVDKVVPGQEANQHRQTRPALRLFGEADR